MALAQTAMFAKQEVTLCEDVRRKGRRPPPCNSSEEPQQLRLQFSQGEIMAGDNNSVKVALLVRLEAKAGKENEVEQFLRSGLGIVQEEPATITWYALRLGPSTFGIFDTFPDNSGRQAHLSGRVAAALMAKAGELLSKPPQIEQVDILAAKLP